jgi:hypothetical protein
LRKLVARTWPLMVGCECTVVLDVLVPAVCRDKQGGAGGVAAPHGSCSLLQERGPVHGKTGGCASYIPAQPKVAAYIGACIA